MTASSSEPTRKPTLRTKMDRLVGGARAEGKDTVKVNPSDASSGLDTENGMLVSLGPNSSLLLAGLTPPRAFTQD